MPRERKTIPQDPEALGLDWAEWQPRKRIAVRKNAFVILQSSAADRENGTIQLSIQRCPFRDDVLRVDSYQEGYFSAFWHSDATRDQFLDEVEKFLNKFEPTPIPTVQPSLQEGDEKYRIGFFRKGIEPAFYSFTRPLTETDLDGEQPMEDETHPLLGLVRLDTPYGDFCYEPQARRLAVIKIIDPTNRDSVVAATTEFVVNTQGSLTPEIVVATLTKLPYIKQLNL